MKVGWGGVSRGEDRIYKVEWGGGGVSRAGERMKRMKVE